MSKPVPSPRWYQPWRQAEARAHDDPADLGTCFGLEVSLSAEPAPRKAATPGRRLGWMQRLAARRRAPA
jgi:hypothetical protein